MDLCPKMLIICLRGVSVHCNKVNFNLGSEHNIIERRPDSQNKSADPLEIMGIFSGSTDVQIEMLYLIWLLLFIPLNDSKGF